MPMWRCPHCGTPQAETSRCWVCKRSSTSCGTCRHFRRSIAGGLGYCGLDRRRLPLRGDELRACWEAAPPSPDPPPAASRRVTPGLTFEPDRPRLDFVPVGSSPGPAAGPARARATRIPATGAREAESPSGGFWSDEG